MILKKTILLTASLINAAAALAQFVVTTNKVTGALTQITNGDDQYRMNWIFSSKDTLLKWQKPTQDWGLGKYTVAGLGVKDEQWATPVSFQDSTHLLYRTKCLEIDVKRYPVGNDFVETYTFRNTTKRKINVTGLEIYAPFNDSYPDAKICATNRCNAHIWAGMNSSYVNAIRMDGVGPHLGLVLLRGAMAGYAIDNRGRYKGIPWTYTASNVRGTIVFNIEAFALEPGKSYTVQWKLFWHNGWDDFYRKAIANGFVKLDADRYVINKNDRLQINVTASENGRIKTKKLIIKGEQLGEHSQRVYYQQGKKCTMLNYLVISSPQNRIDQRMHFIVNHQQMNDIDDPRYGAYMVYDDDLKKIFDKPVGTVSDADRDEGRERLGMGVLVAEWLQKHHDSIVKASLMRYVKFVREKLQTPDFKVYSNVAHKSHPRGYNYPWVAHLYLETYKLTNDKRYLADFYGTMRKYFQEEGYKHYSIDFRVSDGITALKKAGMKTEEDSLMQSYRKVADFFVATGIDYPKHEVNYEQSIVAPAASFLCEMYLLTKEQKYLEGAKLQLRSLEAFSGKQPDVHLNEIAIRHWDGYWFGKTPTWGDVMPHYWSTLSAVAYHFYYLCSGDQTYEKRAKIILNNNLLNFEEDGTAHCAYLYPTSINGKPGKFYDQFANDQDWALVFYNEVILRNTYGEYRE